MNLLHTICTQSAISFAYSPLSLSSVAKWSGIALTSTSRGLLPIDELRVPRYLFKKFFVCQSEEEEKGDLQGSESEEKEGVRGEEEEKVVFRPPKSELLQTMRRQMEESLLSSAKSVIKD